MSAFGLARQLNIPRKEAQKYMDLYFERYPGVLEYMERTRAQAKEQGYVETLDGRRLYLPDIKSSNGARRAGAERAAINAPMQGTAADIIKRAMIAVDEWLRSEKPRVRMIMQVHDELVFEVHKDELDAVSKKNPRTDGEQYYAGGTVAGGSGQRRKLGSSALSIQSATRFSVSKQHNL
ncbi:DNA polymerase I [Klebsiella pneumoniae]|uniref:DNA-directed DNA polymerase n=1 Tax=Klebsiella pneumoniae TaxID=573 RepID=A0A378CKG6_KLEPN|nr:DNA polymerase I [Klebsiella pneumoniae]